MERMIHFNFRYPYATGVTLDRVQMKTIQLQANSSSDENMKFFVKQVILESFAVYWKPKSNLYSEDKNISDEAINLMFENYIGTREKPSKQLKYLLGPISSEATLKWCPSPEKFNYTKPLVSHSLKPQLLNSRKSIEFFRFLEISVFFRIFRKCRLV